MEENILKKHQISNKETEVTIYNTIGTALNWYNFFLYGLLSIFLGQKIFNYENNLQGFYFSLIIFSISLFVMPLSVFQGMFSDKLGRKNIFILNTFILGFFTLIISLLPSYEDFGILGGIFLGIIRVIQGVSINFDETNSNLHMKESLPKKIFLIYNSVFNIASLLGFIMALLTIVSLKDILVTKDFISWGWKIPFIFTIVTMSLTIYLKIRLSESDLFEKNKKNNMLYGLGNDKDLWKKIDFNTLIKSLLSYNILNYVGLYFSTCYLYYYLNILLGISEKGILELLIVPILSVLTISLFLGRLIKNTKPLWIAPISMIFFSIMSYISISAITDKVNPELDKALIIKQIELKRNIDCDAVCLQVQKLLNKNKINFSTSYFKENDKDKNIKLILDKDIVNINSIENVEEVKQKLQQVGLIAKKYDTMAIQFLIFVLLFSYLLLKVTSSHLSNSLFDSRIASTSLNLLNGLGNAFAGIILFLGVWNILLVNNSISMAIWFVPIVGAVSTVFFLIFMRKEMLKNEEI